MSQAALALQPTAAEVEIEQSVLGLLLCGADTAWMVLERITVDDMLEPLHQRIVAAARRVLDAGGEPNPLTMAAAMAADQGLEEVGGPDYFRHLTARYGRNREIAVDICDALSDQAQRRALRYELAQTESRLLDMSTPARDVLAEHETAVRALAEGKPQADDPVTLSAAVSSVVERLDMPAEMRKPLVPYGIAPLDESIGGMAPGDLVIVGARPGMGKTAVALAVADHVSQWNRGVLFVSLEMGKPQLGERWLSMRAYARGEKIPYNLIRLNKVNDRQKDVMAQIASGIADQPLVIDDRRGLTLSQIAVRARAWQSKLRRMGRPLALLVIDHLQLIRPEGSYRGNKVAEITEISGGLKVLAGAMDIPVMCLCQLSRAVESRDDKRPQLSDLRESGAIEQDADVVLLLHRPEYYAQKNRPEPTQHEAIVKWEQTLERSRNSMTIAAAKVRHGKEDEIRLDCQIAYNWIGP